jgi:hypothetical protein
LSEQVSVSDSSAKAGDSTSDAQAAVVSIGGKPALGTGHSESGGGVGGSESGEGESTGSLIDTVDKAPVRVQVAPWKTRAAGSKSSEKRSSSASAALARVEVPDHAKVGLLTSDASAEHTSTKSTGKSTSDAADVSVGETLRLVLLHSEVDSNAKGDTYLVGLNGTKIGTREQLGQLCALELSGVAAVSCLTASGGTANGISTGAAEVLGVESILPFNPASAFATTGTAGTGTEPSILESVLPAVPVAEAPRAAATAPKPSGSAVELPRTGVAAAGLAVSALAGLLVGFVLRLLGRPRPNLKLPA